MDIAELEEGRTPVLVVKEDLGFAEGVGLTLAESTVELAALFTELDTNFISLDFFIL